MADIEIHYFVADPKVEDERVCETCGNTPILPEHYHIFLRDSEYEPAGSRTPCLCGEPFAYPSHKI